MLAKLFSASPKETFKVHDGIRNVKDVINHCLESYKDRPAIVLEDHGVYTKILFRDYLYACRAMIRYFQANGLSQVVLQTFVKNRFEWDVFANASFYTANKLMPLDTKINEVELIHLLSIAAPQVVMVGMAQYERLASLLAKSNLSAKFMIADLVYTFEDEAAGVDVAAFKQKYPQLIYMSKIIKEMGSNEPIEASALLDDPDTVVGLYPTSGTTSLPKIVCITNNNIVCQVNEAVDVINIRPNESLLNIGPYTHIATLVEFFVTKVRGFTVIYFTREPDDDGVLEAEIKKLKNAGFRIKALMAVPMFWIYIFKEVLEEMKAKKVMHTVYHHLLSMELKGDTYDLGTLDKAKLTAANTLLRNKLGGYFSYGISSSMKLDSTIVQIFGKLGVTVLDIYGATEASGIISRNKLNDIVLGSTGRMIDCLEYKITNKRITPCVDQPIGNLLIKGPILAAGYVGQNFELDEEGYYDTGDIGYVDDSRALYIIGRRKELWQLEDGFYVDPQKMSNLMVRSLHVKDAMIIRKESSDQFLTAYIFPDQTRIKKDPEYIEAIHQGIPEREIMRTFFERAIDFTNAITKLNVPIAKNQIYVLPRKLERTPTHKIKFIFELTRLDQASLL